MSWLREAISDSRTGLASSKRVAMVFASLTLCLCTIMLTMIVFWKVEVVPVLVAFGTALAGMAGAGYVMGKPTERTKKDE